MEEEEVVIGDLVEEEAFLKHGVATANTPVSVPLGQRIGAASVGALLTSLATNPLDVVKTRLQTVPTPPPPPPPPTTAGGGGGGAAATGTNGRKLPSACQEYYAMMETIHGAKVPYSKAGGEAAVVYSGTGDALIKIGRAEGLAGLYRGLTPSLVMAVPSTVLYYSLYDSLRALFHHLGAGPVLAPLVGGAFARVVAATATAPFELVRTRMQAEAPASALGASTTIEGFKTITRTSGFLSLWHGLGAQLWRDVPFSAMYWLGYEQLAQALGQREDDGQASYMLKSFGAGAGAGMVAAFLTTPFDVIKTRRQVALPVDSSRSAAPAPSISMRTALRCVVASEGYEALFRGAIPRTLRIGLACAIMISTYEGGKYLFTSETPTKKAETRRSQQKGDQNAAVHACIAVPSGSSASLAAVVGAAATARAKAES